MVNIARRAGMTASVVCLGCLSSCIAIAAEPTTIDLWPGQPPGETKSLPPEENIWKANDPLVGGRPIIKLTNVSAPTLAIYRPAKDKDCGAAVIICPGGGHRILAFDHEGTEVAEWLTTQGVTGIVLKYRVPFRNPEKRWEAAVQDAQRAVSLVRSKAETWNLDPKRTGVLGFSAGGETAALAAILHSHRQYSPIDEVDHTSCRPDFAALIYPGGLTPQDDPWRLREHVRVDATTPPMFLAHSYDDRVPVSNSLLLFADLKKAGVAAELHLYATGGHGYGMRDTGHACNTWSARCADWMHGNGWLKK
jgi:acetyl esterase/lipase